MNFKSNNCAILRISLFSAVARPLITFVIVIIKMYTNIVSIHHFAGVTYYDKDLIRLPWQDFPEF